MTIIDRRHSVSEGTAIKAPCRAATVANIVLAGEQIIDGIAVLEGDRVLVKNQTDATQNGIYEVSTGNWTRTRDFDGAFDIVKGTVVRVTNGSSNIGYWEVTTANPIAVGTTALTFALTTNSISGVSSFVQTLLDDTSAAAFLATLGVVLIPTGTVHAYAGATAPTGFLLCHGQAVPRTTYAALFGVIGATYGAGDGSTTFNLPDLRGRVIAGKDNMGGTSANRLTGLSGGLDGDVLGAVGGGESHALSQSELPIVTPAGTIGGSQALLNQPTGYVADVQTGGISLRPIASATVNVNGSNFTFTGTSFGGGGAHNNVQPTAILNYIIKT
jgi:microcystin-dependent protein/uncharacterized cupin superfamily protein